MRRRAIGTSLAAALVLASAAIWLFAAEGRGAPPHGAYSPIKPAEWLLTGPNADARRNVALRRAQVRLEPQPRFAIEDAAAPFPRDRSRDLSRDKPLVCRFVNSEPTGTSPKFDCVLDGGQIVKVKYGRNPEIYGETAASSLLPTLGYAADHVDIAPHLRCYGCPRRPFLISRLLWFAGVEDLLSPHGYENGYSDFEWAAVEWRFDAPAIETEAVEGWAWYELAHSEAPKADLDAFRLLAAFLAHWDNKRDNQRLVCLDDLPAPADATCARPLLMIQDLGATFGPVKVNLTGWRDRPVWADRRECLLSMRSLPWHGATFPDVRIGEAGRLQLARGLAALSEDDVRRLFLEARFPRYYSGTNDERDLEAWTAAFRNRVDQILTAGPCPNP